MFPSNLDSYFYNVALPYGAWLPVGVLCILSLVALAGIMRGGNAWNVAYATYCYLAESIGIMLIAAGSLPVLHAVMTQGLFEGSSYASLLLIFAAGGILFLWHDAKLRQIDAAAKAVPEAIFYFSWKLIGLLLASFALLSLILSIMIDTIQLQTAAIHVTVLVFGVALGWFTKVPMSAKPSVTTRTLMSPMPAVAAKAKKLVSAKKSSKKKR